VGDGICMSEKQFGAIMKIHRKNKGISLSKMSLDIGLSRSYLSRLEGNKRPMSNIFSLVKICAYLDISPSMVLENLCDIEKNKDKTL